MAGHGEIRVNALDRGICAPTYKTRRRQNPAARNLQMLDLTAAIAAADLLNTAAQHL
jgi:hypothetical protein